MRDRDRRDLQQRPRLSDDSLCLVWSEAWPPSWLCVKETIIVNSITLFIWLILFYTVDVMSHDWHLDPNERHAVNCIHSNVTVVREWRGGYHEIGYGSVVARHQVIIEVLGIERETTCIQQQDGAAFPSFKQARYYLNMTDMARVETEADQWRIEYPPGKQFSAFYCEGDGWRRDRRLDAHGCHPEWTPSEIVIKYTAMHLVRLAVFTEISMCVWMICWLRHVLSHDDPFPAYVENCLSYTARSIMIVGYRCALLCVCGCRRRRIRKEDDTTLLPV